MKFTKNHLLLYAVTDRAWTGVQTLEQQVECALKGGATMVQLREKNIGRQQLIAQAKALLPICRRYNVPLILNDDVEAALLSGADGVHVGASDRPVEQIRKMAGRPFIIGATAKTVKQAQQAYAQGADYLGVGAVFGSPTKPEAIAITMQTLKQICSAVPIPAVAIGGIGLNNMSQLAGSGIAGVAVVSAVFAAEDITAQCQRLRAAAEQLVL